MTTTSWESRLRADLRDLADVPGPDGSADRALAGARNMRRRRRVLAVAGPVVLAVLVAFPVVTRVPSFFGFGGTAPCETATDEANPPRQTPASKQPRFVRAVLSKLPRGLPRIARDAPRRGDPALGGHRPRPHRPPTLTGDHLSSSALDQQTRQIYCG